MRLNVKSRDIFHRYQVCFLERERSNRSIARVSKSIIYYANR